MYTSTSKTFLPMYEFTDYLTGKNILIPHDKILYYKQEENNTIIVLITGKEILVKENYDNIKAIIKSIQAL